MLLGGSRRASDQIRPLADFCVAEFLREMNGPRFAEAQLQLQLAFGQQAREI
jgi:hypothetical protein